MDNSRQLYNKAVRFYNEGYIDKAIEYCERSISENIKNTSAINLKGLLYYFKGELKSAEALWKMNFQVNRDSVSKKYLEDSESDNNKILIYKAALIAIKELKLRDAVSLLQKCRESDFNSLNVNNSLAICYIKLGEYNNAKRHIEEVFKIDKKNTIAAKSKNELIGMGVIKREFRIKYYTIAILCLVLVVLVKLSVGDISKILENKNKNIVKMVKSPQVNVTPGNATKMNITDSTKIVNKKVFPNEELSKAISEKDFEKLYNIISEWKDKDLTINDNSLFQKGIELLKSDGINYFYNRGRQALIDNDYKASENYFTMAYNYGKDYYLFQDILYMLGYNYKNDNQIDNCLKYYEEYDSKFPKGTYEETILYDMTLIYKSVDIKKSKDYASRLVKEYPKSIYNNSIIKNILDS